MGSVTFLSLKKCRNQIQNLYPSCCFPHCFSALSSQVGKTLKIRGGDHIYIGHTLFSGMGSWAKEPQSVGESSDRGDAVAPTGTRAAMADISPVWLSAVIPGRSEVGFMLLSTAAPIPIKCWIRHFRNCTKNNSSCYCVGSHRTSRSAIIFPKGQDFRPWVLDPDERGRSAGVWN